MSLIQDHFVKFQETRILVADDDPILREFAAVHLSTPNVEIELAEDGMIALERLKRGGIDLALVDLEMPRMDGFELITHIRSHALLKHMPVVVVTGREDMLAVDRAFSLGATSFVIKPLNWRVLLHQLAYVLKNAKADEALRLALETSEAKSGLKTQIIKSLEQALTSPLAQLKKQWGEINANPLYLQTPEYLADLKSATERLTTIHHDLGHTERLLED